MKADIDRLMAARGLDGLVVVIDKPYSPQLDYLVGRIEVSDGLVFKDWQAAPVLVVNAMERDGAAQSGLRVLTYSDLGYYDLLKAHDNDVLAAKVALWGKCLPEFGTPNGRVGIYGTARIEAQLALVSALQTAHPHYEFVGETSPTLFDIAARTKGEDELRRMRSVAERTNAVAQATWEFIAGHRASGRNGSGGEIVVKRDGSPLTIGDVKRFIRRALLDRKLEAPFIIFAQGRDAGVPHNSGGDSQPLMLGTTIVLDLAPHELGGGYFHDMTRTWCIGYASDEVLSIYHTVMEAFEIAEETYSIGRPMREVQTAVQDYFEGRGHRTDRSHPGTTEGYVHSVGHGIGLNVHESYVISHRNQDDTFEVGNVFTIEPGLYYPERGYGVRIEDTVYAATNSGLMPLTEMHKDLILPLRG